jgi:hypothetical protein
MKPDKLLERTYKDIEYVRTHLLYGESNPVAAYVALGNTLTYIDDNEEEEEDEEEEGD